MKTGHICSAFYGDEYDTKYATFDQMLHAAFIRDGETFGAFFSLNQLIRKKVVAVEQVGMHLYLKREVEFACTCY